MYKVKKLTTERDQYGRTVWPAEYPETFYSWCGAGFPVCFEYHKDCEQSLDIAKTLSEAQNIVNEHHEKRINDLLMDLLEKQ